ncbi:outer membrane lipoprotein chaperone LolA [Rosettibacter firmus]|uniref:outer membrane lipoprotein chaperone LolA n=1 Tax=Rosettibacter firmus TaxID=3111522 RepID=UPI00336C00B4
MKQIIILLLTANILFAQIGTETLRKIQNKFNTISDFTASFIQYDCTSSMKNSSAIQGKILYKKKNKFIVELKNQVIISNGEIIWNYNKKQKQVIISNLNDEPNTYSIEKIIYNYPSLCNIRYLKKELDEDVIELLPKEGMLDIKNIKIWKDKNDFISKLEITDIGDMCYRIHFKDILINQNITDSKFTFNPPKGIHIVDLR